MNPALHTWDPKRRFRFWGTVMVGMCFLTGIVGYGGGRYSFGIFVRPMTQIFGWSRTEISLGATINLICYAVASPLVGKLLDTVGIRLTMITGSALAGLAFTAMFFCKTLWMFYLLYGVGAAVGINMMGRIAQATIVANWFVRLSGLMMGITALSIGLGTSIMAPAANAILHRAGWQAAFLFLGASFLAFVFLPALIVIKGKGRPEDRGFGPDGIPLEVMPGSLQAAARPLLVHAERDWTVRAALRTKTFWGIFVAMGLSYMADYILLFHSVAHFVDIGFSPGLASSVLAAATLVSCFGRVGFGWLADRVNIRACMALMLAVQIVAMPFLIFGGSRLTPVYIFAGVWGIGYGGLATLLPAAANAYFGRRHFGSIFGWITMGTVLGGAIGSTLGGWIYDVHGSYEPAWYACVVMRVGASVAVFALAKTPHQKA